MPTNQIVPQDNVGKVFERLTIIREFRRPIKTIPSKTELIWEYRCACGTIKIARASSIKRKLIRSCGCLRRIRTHGLSRTPEYRIWAGIVQRTANSNNPSYDNYGGREDVPITFYEPWRRDFTKFFVYVGKRPSPDLTIERIDNNKGYEPGNVKWDTRHNQNRNHRGNRMITFRDETLCLKDWAKRIGVDAKTIAYRLRKWPIETALTMPNLKGRKLVNRKSHEFQYPD